MNRMKGKGHFRKSEKRVSEERRYYELERG